jgi:trehalose utilization protein
MRVLVWNEHRAEREIRAARSIYPDGIHAAVAHALREHLPGVEVVTATLDDPEAGLSADAVDTADAIVWWGHRAHDEVPDGAVERVVSRVRRGGGLIVLHSAHLSRPFRALLGTPCTLEWREADDLERVWTVAPDHPIAAGVPSPFVIPTHEMYGEPFAIPAPDELVFVSWFSGGEVFRSGCCYRRGEGRIFYFSPGHETFPVYHQPEVARILANAVVWAGAEAAPVT